MGVAMAVRIPPLDPRIMVMAIERITMRIRGRMGRGLSAFGRASGLGVFIVEGMAAALLLDR